MLLDGREGREVCTTPSTKDDEQTEELSSLTACEKQAKLRISYQQKGITAPLFHVHLDFLHVNLELLGLDHHGRIVVGVLFKSKYYKNWV